MKKQIGDTKYFVDEVGNVYGRQGKKLSTWRGNTGYLKVKLSINKKWKDFYVHRLVAQAFVPNPDNLPQVKHIDNDKTNCVATNLEWGTNQENTTEGYRDGLYRFRQRCHSVRATHKESGESTVFKSIRSLSKALGYNRKTVVAILDGWKTNNFDHTFEYAMS